MSEAYQKLSHNEREQARFALIEWFKSQEIGPAEASFIMAGVIADQLTEKTLDVVELQGAINLYKIVIAVEVADFVKFKKGRNK